MAGHDGRWYVVKVDARRSEIADHLAALGFEVLGMFDGYMIIRSLNMKNDARGVEETSGISAILKKAGVVEYAEIADEEVFNLVGSWAAPPAPLAKTSAGRAGQARPPDPVGDGFAQLATHRELKRRRKNEKRIAARRFKAQLAT